MVISLVLITGVIFILLVGAIICLLMGATSVLISLIPLAPGLVMVGTALIMLSELLLIFGNKDDRRQAAKDFSYLVPVFLVSLGLWYGTQYYLW